MLQVGISNVAWSVDGGALIIHERGSKLFHQISFAHSFGNHTINVKDIPLHRMSSQVIDTRRSNFFLLGSDRILLISEGVHGQGKLHKDAFSRGTVADVDNAEYTVHHVRIPNQYAENSYPIRSASVNPAGTDIVIAGRRGFGVYQMKQGRWRLFGDVSQERRLKTKYVNWLDDNIIVAGSDIIVPGRNGEVKKVSTNMCLYFYPKHHLDESSLLGKYELAAQPRAMDVTCGRVCIAYDNEIIQILKVWMSSENQIDVEVERHIELKAASLKMPVKLITLMSGANLSIVLF